MALINAITFGKNAMQFVALANCINILRGKATIPMVKPVVMSSFVCGIGIVFSFSAYLQMFGIYASRCVAFVHNYFAGRYFANKSFIRKSVSANAFPINQNNTVTIAIFCSSPKPTTVSFFDFCIKRFVNSNARMLRQFLIAPCFVVMGAA